MQMTAPQRVYMSVAGGCGIEYVGSPPPAFSVPGRTSTPFLITMWSAVLAGMTPPSGRVGMPTMNGGAEATAAWVPTAAAVALARFASIAAAEPADWASCTSRVLTDAHTGQQHIAQPIARAGAGAGAGRRTRVQTRPNMSPQVV